MIHFSIPYRSRNESKVLSEVLNTNHRKGDGYFTKKATHLLEEMTSSSALLTPSCTAALEIAALLCDIKPGDEVIMPSFTFVSTANAFLLRGAKIVFVDIDRVSMNIQPECIEAAITNKTKAIVIVHYAGVPCDIKEILRIKEKYNCFLIEDAAQAIGSYFNGKHLGTFGDVGCISFHDTKNINCGEGGAIFINNETLIERCEIIREKGTNRKAFFNGAVDKYTWKSVGSSYLPSEFQSAILFDQLKYVRKVNELRKEISINYYHGLRNLEGIELMDEDNLHSGNGHLFFIKSKSSEQRNTLLQTLNKNGINATFHYIPLHSTDFGKHNSLFLGEDKHTTSESNRLIRLPLHTYLTKDDIHKIIDSIKRFYV